MVESKPQRKDIKPFALTLERPGGTVPAILFKMDIKAKMVN